MSALSLRVRARLRLLRPPRGGRPAAALALLIPARLTVLEVARNSDPANPGKNGSTMSPKRASAEVNQSIPVNPPVATASAKSTTSVLRPSSPVKSPFVMCTPGLYIQIRVVYSPANVYIGPYTAPAAPHVVYIKPRAIKLSRLVSQRHRTSWRADTYGRSNGLTRIPHLPGDRCSNDYGSERGSA